MCFWTLFSVPVLEAVHPDCFVRKMLFHLWLTAHPTSFGHYSLFSRYGVRAFPAILLVNETSMVRYRGTKDLKSLVDFYKETTGTTIIFAVWF
jgi:hypothetical protein